MKSAFKTSLAALIVGTSLFTASIAAAQMPPVDLSQMDMSAHMPPKDEMRQIMLDMGMSPAMIEKELNNLYPNSDPVSDGKPTLPPTTCQDENENNVCDEEENDPEITECRTTYLDAITKYARDNYGDYLGTNASFVAGTCGLAAAHGAGYVQDGALLTDLDKLRVYSDYWTRVAQYGSYIYRSELESALGSDDEDFERMLAAMPPAMRTMTEGDGTSDTRSVGLSVHTKCENIRRQVGQSYRKSVLDRAVCVKHVPQPDLTEEPSDE